jgi:hypothetical protein
LKTNDVVGNPRNPINLVFVLFSFFMLQATPAKNELESRAATRTAALTKANEDLHQEISERQRAEESLRENVAALKNALEEIQLLKDQLYNLSLPTLASLSLFLHRPPIGFLNLS